MPQGLQAFDENGHMVVDISDRLTHVLGSTITQASGYIDVPGSGQGNEIWAAFIPLNANQDAFNQTLPKLYIEGDRVRWDYAVPAQISVTWGLLIYGRY